MTVDGWRDAIAFPLFDGFGPRPPGTTGDPFAPRRSRDRAARYDVPGAVRWLIRQLLGAGFVDAAGPDERCLVFKREPLTVRLDHASPGWTVHLYVGEGSHGRWIALPRFEGVRLLGQAAPTA